ncbi:MAG: CHAT domain-containing protein [Anaerolineae bacterium]
MSDKHTDILVRIRRWDEESAAYPVEAELDDGSFFHGGELRLDKQAMQAVESDPEQYGLDLFYALFSGPIRRAYDKATGRAEAQTEGRLRVRFWIDDDAAELHALPWERIYHVHRGQPVPLSISTLTPFSRYTGLEIPEPQPITTRPIRLLVAISNPHNLQESGFSPIDVEQEVENMRHALDNLHRGGQIQVTLMPGQSGLSAELRAQLEGEGYQIQDGATSLDGIMRMLTDCHVFHFLGHGTFRRRGDRGEGTAALYLEQDDGTWQAVRDDDIVSRLVAAAPALRLVFLAACESAKRDAEAEHPFVGLAPKLVKAGVPAVVAMQEKVPMALARELTSNFYHRLLEHGRIDRALNQARSMLFERKETDWAIPVLFMRLDEGQLFATDPVRLALQAIRAHEPYHPWAEHEYLPIEVVHATGHHDAGSLERLQRESAPAADMVEETIHLFSTRHIASSEHELDRARSRPLLVGLVGGHGTTKSTLLRRIAWITADRSLRPASTSKTDTGPNVERQVIPIYVDLLDLQRYPSAQSSLGNPIKTLMLESLKPFWPNLTSEHLSDLLRRNHGPILRVLLDGSNDLPNRQRIQTLNALQSLVHDYPHHEYMLAISPSNLDPRQLSITDLLIIQPLSQRKIRQFLQGLNAPASRRLYGALARAQLFDLAANPWLLVKMLIQARAGIYPQSRTAVLQSLVEDGIADIPNEHGMRSRAEQTLTALAWEMQSARSNTWPVSDAFRTFAAIRGNREYSLEGLYDALVECGLLAQVGQESMRFAYPPIRAYCCARAILKMDDHIRVMDDITATLGRLIRLRWWEDTLILLSGLMDDPNTLIRKLLYGATLAGGERLLLAAHCLLESGERQIDPDLLNQVVGALVWQLDSTNERSIQRRARAASALGQLTQSHQLQSLSAIPHLARVANREIRVNWRGETRYEYSNVRMAAAVALQQLRPLARGEIKAADPQLDEILYLWEKANIEALDTHLHSADEGIQAIAAFALGELQTPKAVDILVTAFLNFHTKSHTRWALTDALALLDPAVVTRRAILPFLDAETAEREGLDPNTWRWRAAWYERLAYLIGKVRARHPVTRAFLERCLFKFTGTWLTAKAVQSLGWMYERSYKDLFERIALGDFSDGIALSEKASKWDSKYLQRKAIEALANIGDRDTLTRLRAKRADWGPELERIFYWTSEEIYWRLESGGGQ